MDPSLRTRSELELATASLRSRSELSSWRHGLLLSWQQRDVIELRRGGFETKKPKRKINESNSILSTLWPRHDENLVREYKNTSDLPPSADVFQQTNEFCSILCKFLNSLAATSRKKPEMRTQRSGRSCWGDGNVRNDEARLRRVRAKQRKEAAEDRSNAEPQYYNLIDVEVSCFPRKKSVINQFPWKVDHCFLLFFQLNHRSSRAAEHPNPIFLLALLLLWARSCRK